MSLCRGNRAKKVRKQDHIELNSILNFIKFIQCISCGMLGIAIIGLLIIRENISAQVVYIMTIVVNLIIIFGGRISIKYLSSKKLDKCNTK